MSMEPIDRKKVMAIVKHFGLVPIKIKGTTQVNICKTMNESKYQLISWDEFFETLDKKGLQVYKDSSSAFLKIMKKK